MIKEEFVNEMRKKIEARSLHDPALQCAVRAVKYYGLDELGVYMSVALAVCAERDRYRDQCHQLLADRRRDPEFEKLIQQEEARRGDCDPKQT